MSHELRTPLNGVIGLASLLDEAGLPAPHAEHITTIRECGEALLGTIGQLLDMARIEEQGLVLQVMPLNMRELCETCTRIVAERAQSKGVMITCVVELSVPGRVSGDMPRLRQVLLNLLGNAVKFTDQGTVVLRCRCLERLESRARLSFSVSDTGIGKNSETIDRIFNPFVQADATVTRRFGGTGLGLAISRQIAEVMGGDITATSRPGMGSTFEFIVEFEVLSDEAADRLPLVGMAVGVCESHPVRCEELTTCLIAAGARICVQSDLPAVVILGDGIPPPAWAASPVLACRNLVAPDSGGRPTITRPVASSAVIQGIISLLTPRAAAPPPAPVVAAGGQEKGAAPQALRILVVDDNAVNLRVARALLERLGHAVTAVDSGPAALENLEGQDLVFMDCEMPGMDGLEATRRIRAWDADHRLPVIALTADATVENRDACLAAGMDAFLSKPIRMQDIHGILARWS